VLCIALTNFQGQLFRIREGDEADFVPFPVRDLFGGFAESHSTQRELLFGRDISFAALRKVEHSPGA
jgi:hypothetical protein